MYYRPFQRGSEGLGTARIRPWTRQLGQGRLFKGSNRALASTRCDGALPRG